MARYIGPQKKVLRRFHLLPDSPVETNTQSTGRPNRKSVYGIRLDEKQKLKFIYGILERQFRRYFAEARKNPANTGFILMQLLERRLDNVVFRLGLAKTRKGARQMVNHGHVQVNGKEVDIPSYNVKVTEIISLHPKLAGTEATAKLLEETKEAVVPTWLQRKGTGGVVKSLPTEDDVQSDIDLQLIIEYYSR